jgi:hypothetical protein
MMELTYCPDGVIGIFKQRRCMRQKKRGDRSGVMAFNDKVRIEQCMGDTLMEQNNETLSSYDTGRLSSSNSFNWVG